MLDNNAIENTIGCGNSSGQLTYVELVKRPKANPRLLVAESGVVDGSLPNCGDSEPLDHGHKLIPGASSSICHLCTHEASSQEFSELLARTRPYGDAANILARTRRLATVCYTLNCEESRSAIQGSARYLSAIWCPGLTSPMRLGIQGAML